MAYTSTSQQTGRPNPVLPHLASDTLSLCWHTHLLSAHCCNTRAGNQVHLHLEAVLTLYSSSSSSNNMHHITIIACPITYALLSGYAAVCLVS